MLRHFMDMEQQTSTAVTLTGAIEGDYVVEDARSDGRLVLRPDLSAQAILARHGETPLSAEEFADHFGDLPADDDQG